jgi:hypothetical protein
MCLAVCRDRKEMMDAGAFSETELRRHHASFQFRLPLDD